MGFPLTGANYDGMVVECYCHLPTNMTYRDSLDTIRNECAAIHRLYLDLANEIVVMIERGEDTHYAAAQSAASIKAYFELMLKQGALLKHISKNKLKLDDKFDLRDVAAKSVL